MTTPVRVYPADLSNIAFCGKVGLCMRGCRHWAAQHGFSWSDFIRNGILADVLLATGDPVAEQAVAVARARQARETEEITEAEHGQE